jgi:hypothetical protein
MTKNIYGEDITMNKSTVSCHKKQMYTAAAAAGQYELTAQPRVSPLKYLNVLSQSFVRFDVDMS